MQSNTNNNNKEIQIMTAALLIITGDTVRTTVRTDNMILSKTQYTTMAYTKWLGIRIRDDNRLLKTA